MRTDAESARHLRAGLASHHAVVAARQLAFARRRKLLAQQLGDGEAEHAVADELKALVVAVLALAAAHAGVRERQRQEILVLEAVAQRLLEFLEFARAKHDREVTASPLAAGRIKLQSRAAALLRDRPSARQRTS